MKYLLFLLALPSVVAAQNDALDELSNPEPYITSDEISAEASTDKKPSVNPEATPADQTSVTPPEQVEVKLEKAEAQYEHALKLFNPWYTGPLITPSATMVPPGQALIQPYIFFTDNYAAYDQDRHVVDAPNRFSIKAQPILLQVGVTSSVDATLIMGAVENWSKGKSGGGFLDTTAQVGFLINDQTFYVPKSKFSIAQSFPTGSYENLSSNGLGLDATGAGAYQTTFTFAFGKLILWNTLHPMNTRLALGYTLSTPVKVKNFNAYGGGHGTKGTVHPGNSFSADLGLELSITQPWVVALDIVYNYTSKTTFHGKPGVLSDGTPASVGGGYSDQLSLAPAFEYNFTANMGIVAGIWFSVYGRNAPDFVSGVFSWYFEFP